MGADILFSPSHVWPAVGQMHAEMAAFSAIENGVTIVCQEDQGISDHINPYGRFLTTAVHNAGECMLVADLPIIKNYHHLPRY